MQSLAARKADRAKREEIRKDQLREEGAPESIIEGGNVTTLNDSQSGEGNENNNSGFDVDKASFMELKAYVEERGETVTPGTSTDQLKERAKALQAKPSEDELKNNGGGGWPA